MTTVVSRVVILGGSGFIGRPLLDRFQQSEIEVIGLSSRDIDLTLDGQGGKLASQLQNQDTLIVLSAITPDRGRGIGAFCDNMAMIRNVSDALQQMPVAHVVYLSSDAVYSFRDIEIDEETPPAPSDLYGAMHLARELALKDVCQDIPLTLVRMTMVFGNGDPHNSYGPNRLRRMAAAEGAIKLFGKGEETRDHLYLPDAVAALFLISVNRIEGLYNLASGEAICYDDLAHKIAALHTSPVSVQHQERNNEITHRSFEMSKLKAVAPTFSATPIEDALTEVHKRFLDGED